MDSFRDAQIRRIVAHAWRNVPYYRALFHRHGIAPADIRGEADLIHIPITTRSDMQNARFEDRLSRNVDPKKLLQFKTTGSSGQCLTVMRTWREQKLLSMFVVRAMRSFGLRQSDVIGIPRVRVPAHPRDHQLPRRIADAFGVFRTVIVDPRSGTDHVQSLYDLRSEVIQGWPTILAAMAPRWRQLNNADGRERRLKFVIAGGEMLTPAAREQISLGFGAPVREIYGAHEFSLVAWQCVPTGALHLSDETLYAEVVRDGTRVKPGEEGETVVTALHSFAMPFIRYNLGDVVVQGSAACSCGSPFSTISAIRGRSGDYLALPNGRTVHPQDIARDSYRAAPWIKQLQVVRQAADRFELHVVLLREPSASEMEAVRPAVAGLLGPGISFEVLIVPSIETAVESKFSVYRSNVP